MENESQSTIERLNITFETECNHSLSVYFNTMQLYNESTPNFPVVMRDMLVEYILLRIFATWERFLEGIFVAYMLGESSISGKKPERYAFPRDASHALALVRNVNTYPDWADIDKVLINANNFFESGGPFNILKTTRSHINAIRKIRNAIAHVSGKATSEFENLVRGNIGHLPEKMTPAVFLCSKKGKKKNDPTYCEFYIDFLRDTAKMLIDFDSIE